MCLCDRDTCNGPSLPPREILEDDHDIIDIEEVIKEMNQEPREVEPEAVSSDGIRRTMSDMSAVLYVMFATIQYSSLLGSIN